MCAPVEELSGVDSCTCNAVLRLSQDSDTYIDLISTEDGSGKNPDLWQAK